MAEDVIITGASGFVGSHVAAHLASNGYHVHALALPGERIPDALCGEGITVVRADLATCDIHALVLPTDPVCLFHFAWAGVAPESRNSIDEQKRNIDLTLRAVELAHLLGAKRFVFPGSTMEYSYAGTVINRSTPPTPQDAYGVAKISARYFAELLCRQYGIDFLYTVISGIYAPDRLGSNVITYTIEKLLAGERPSLTKLEQLWDYVHIDDVVRAFQLVMERGKNGGFYCIGHGDNWPLHNYIYLIRDLIDPSLPLGVGDVPYKDEVMPMSCVDLSEIELDTGYEPAIDFKDGVASMIEAVRRRMGKRSEN